MDVHYICASVSRAAIRDYHTLGGSKQQKFIPPPFWKGESLKSVCWEGCFLLETVRKNLFRAPLLAAAFLPVLGACELGHTSPHFLPHLHMALYRMCPSLCPLLFSQGRWSLEVWPMQICVTSS